MEGSIEGYVPFSSGSILLCLSGDLFFYRVRVKMKVKVKARFRVRFRVRVKAVCSTLNGIVLPGAPPA